MIEPVVISSRGVTTFGMGLKSHRNYVPNERNYRELNAIVIYFSSMRRGGDSAIYCELNVRERDAVNDMKVRGGFQSDASLLRSALYFYARHFDLHLDTALFALRNPNERRTCAAARHR